jgi:hypothetical protein
MAEGQQTSAEVVWKVLRDQQADVIRDAVKTMAREIMDADAGALDRAETRWCACTARARGIRAVPSGDDGCPRIGSWPGLRSRRPSLTRSRT